ncbi:TPA: [FeFe] hydrogenase H-cluster radical SAM maturase HydE [Candidatus Sumerlaeota bacterium]|nr:[FeFe] hydrogenase H-cluster radical SAM maturase HydE [Candidatus Sumerlaeota bacterium]
MNEQEIVGWLRETDETRLEELWKRADNTRKKNVGDAVHLRGLIEISNHCTRSCGYCGLRAQNTKIERYRMEPDEILECANKAKEFGYGTVVMQSGEDLAIASGWVAALIRRIKEETGLAVTLSLGEREEQELTRWKNAGADRYLLRFETSNRALFDKIHPPLGEKPCDRIALLKQLKHLGFETGSGALIGIPGQSYEDLARDIMLFAELGLDMIGCGPYIPHPETPLASEMETALAGGDETQVPNTELMAYKVIALARLVCPRANIPSTTAIATLNPARGREFGLERGANVVMPNLTPVKYRALYEIYPGKACITETADACAACLRGRIESIGRQVGTGRGDSMNYLLRS